MTTPRTIVFFDLDFTLADFSHAAGIEALCQYLRNHLPDREARSVSKFVDYEFEATWRCKQGGERYLMLDAAKNLFWPRVKSTVESPDLSWSREIWIMAGIRSYLLKPFGIKPSVIQQAADAYWQGIADNARIYPFALWCAGLLKDRGCTLAIATSPDTRLYYRNLYWRYDPEYSRTKKLERISRLKPLADTFDLVCIGDPVGKPHKEFWQRALKEVGAKPGDRLFMVGDEYHTDIVGASDMNMFTILVDRNGKYKDSAEVPRANRIIRSLTEVPKYGLKGGFP